MAAAAPLTPVLQLRGLSKNFGRRTALEEVSFAVSPGEFTGLLGPNGAGKTTLASLVAGLLAPDGGTVELFGTTLAADRSGVLAGLGVVFQSRSLDLEMSVRANLVFHATLFGIGRGRDDRHPTADSGTSRLGRFAAGIMKDARERP